MKRTWLSKGKYAKKFKPLPIVEESIDIDFGWVVDDLATAWNCALDVESWLSIKFASDGIVKLVSGEPGQIGSAYLHSRTVAPTSFAIYHVEEIDPAKYTIKLSKNRDLQEGLTLRINPTPSVFGTYEAYLNCKLSISDLSRGAQIGTGYFEAVTSLLEVHFKKYVTTVAATPIATALALP